MRIEVASVDSVIIYFGEIISKENNQKVKSAFNRLKSLKNSGIIELIPSYNSLLITYDIFIFNYQSIQEFLLKEISKKPTDFEEERSLITIDVYYGEEVGFDLISIAKEKNLSAEEVIEIHSEKFYDLYAIGFLPGFAYLAKLDERICSSRLATPRKKIPKGSVAIADTQTAIYPRDSPGGWKILGKTALELFDKNSRDLSPLSINSQVKFNPISKEEFLFQGGTL